MAWVALIYNERICKVELIGNNDSNFDLIQPNRLNCLILHRLSF